MAPPKSLEPPTLFSTIGKAFISYLKNYKNAKLPTTKTAQTVVCLCLKRVKPSLPKDIIRLICSYVVAEGQYMRIK
jgi:hypothetical protein